MPKQNPQQVLGIAEAAEFLGISLRSARWQGIFVNVMQV